MRRAVCSAASCLRLAEVGDTRCAAHAIESAERRKAYLKQANKDYNARRPQSDSFYKSVAWKRKSVSFRRAHPLCCECERIGLTVESTMVDHIEPYRLRPDLGLVDSNLRALCWQCHNRIGKRVRADEAAELAGGLGRLIR